MIPLIILKGQQTRWYTRYPLVLITNSSWHLDYFVDPYNRYLNNLMKTDMTIALCLGEGLLTDGKSISFWDFPLLWVSL